MTPIADMVEQMVAEGVPMSIILLAVRTAELAMATGNSGGIPVDKTAEKRRAYDRERKAKTKVSGGIPPEFPPEHKIALSSSSLIETQKEEEKEESKRPPKRKSGRSLPADWHPSESHYKIGQKLSRTREHVDREAESMRLWATANSNRAVARKADWDATFTGWLRRSFTPLHQNPRDAQQQRSDDAYEQLRAFNRSGAADDRAGAGFLLENTGPGTADFHDGDDRTDDDLSDVGRRAFAERH